MIDLDRRLAPISYRVTVELEVETENTNTESDVASAMQSYLKCKVGTQFNPGCSDGFQINAGKVVKADKIHSKLFRGI